MTLDRPALLAKIPDRIRGKMLLALIRMRLIARAAVLDFLEGRT